MWGTLVRHHPPIQEIRKRGKFGVHCSGVEAWCVECFLVQVGTERVITDG